MTELEIERIRKQIEDHSIYKLSRYNKWRRRIYKRDGYSCQYPNCKYPKGKLNAHHIYMKWYYPERIYDIKNGITLCEYHHNYVHKHDSNEFVELLEDIAKKNCKKPKISKKIYGKKKKKKKKKVTKKVSKKTKKVGKKKVRRARKKVVRFKKTRNK